MLNDIVATAARSVWVGILILAIVLLTFAALVWLYLAPNP